MELYEADSGSDDFTATVDAVAGMPGDIIGVHLVYSWEHTPAVVAMLKAIATRTNAPVIAYGLYPTFAADHLMRTCPFIDGVVRGEPEETFLEVCFQAGSGNADFSRIKGLVWRRGGTCVVNPPRDAIRDLDSLPFPHRTRAGLARCGGAILGSRGCYGDCTFCHINAFYGGKPSWRGRSPTNIHAEVKALLPRLSSKYLYFVDANFFGPGESGQRRAEAIAECLEDEAGLSFGLECRANDVRERSLGRLVRAGLRDVFLGIESGSPCCLERINKRASVQQNTAAIALLRRYGIEPHIGFIMFEPDSTMEDVRSNISFLQSNNLLERLTASVDLLYHQGVALMGTRLYARLRDEGRLLALPEGPYHGKYRFRDERVQICADIISALCRHLLRLMDAPGSSLYWQQLYAREDGRPSSGVAAEINRWLVSRFEEALQRLAGDGSASTQEQQDRFIEASLSSIDQALSGDALAGTASAAEHHD